MNDLDRTAGFFLSAALQEKNEHSAQMSHTKNVSSFCFKFAQKTHLIHCLALLALSDHPAHAGGKVSSSEGVGFTNTVLVANRAHYKPTAFVDEYLINPWGIALRPPGTGGHIWLSNAANLTTTTYIGDANGAPLHQDGLKVVHIEGPMTSFWDGLAHVTGQVYNAASDIEGQPVEFPISGPASNLSGEKPESIGVTSGAAKFVFVTTYGSINAWRANTATSMDKAVIVKDFTLGGPDCDRSLPFYPAFTGVAMTTDAFKTDDSGKHVADNRLYACDFQNKTIRVFDNQWKNITSQVIFERPKNLGDDYSPYNIQWLNGRLYVAYAIVDQQGEEVGADVPGVGVGHIVAYDRNGRLLQEFQDMNVLSSPWGLAIAPEGFGSFGGCLLVANFGDGTISAFDVATGKFTGYLRDSEKHPISIDGIWGLTFGNGVSLGDSLSLYYTAGPNGEQDGIFGRLAVAGSQPPKSQE